MSADGLRILGFRHQFELFDKATGELIHQEVKYNRIPQAGIDFLIQTPFGDQPPIPNFYCTLFTNNVVPDAAMTAASIPSVLGEFVDYDETTRPEWVKTYNNASTYDNTANKAVFTPNADRAVYGSIIVSNPVKGSNTGLLLSVVRFDTVKNVSNGLEAKLVCGLTYIPTNII